MQILQLTSMLNRWCQVREDLLYAFSQCRFSDLDENLKDAIQDMLTRVQSGMSLEDSINLLKDYSDNEQFQDLVTAISVNLRYRGNLPALLENMEYQFNRLEEAYQQRKISMAADFRLTIILLMAVPVITAFRLPAAGIGIQDFFVPGPGLFCLLVGALCYGLAALALLKIKSLLH